MARSMHEPDIAAKSASNNGFNEPSFGIVYYVHSIERGRIASAFPAIHVLSSDL